MLLTRSALINDITTSPDAPPEFRALAREGGNDRREMSYPARFAITQLRLYPDLAPLRSDLPPAQVFELVQAAALEMARWEIASVEAARLSLEAVATSGWLRFKDDVVIQVRAEVRAEGSIEGGAMRGGSTVHMRSKSRLGRHDFGVNAKRIRAFFAHLSAKLS